MGRVCLLYLSAIHRDGSSVFIILVCDTSRWDEGVTWESLAGESEFLKETDVLFNLCYEVFNNVNEQLEEEEDEAVSVVEAAAAKRSLKQLLAHVRK
ncbi:hypothetical protein DPMN_110743 [Dreissena polymorpha]|uniref:Uncharacterized protein n=1 Tax=Dreissena polymorpha TaxID=45954 RepID=A0A9D4KDJ1_DREPO|nr:hypothetical protein DPMN_110743 [Dreissena polymorpha]